MKSRRASGDESESAATALAAWRPTPVVLLLAAVLLVGAIVAAESMVALAIVLMEGMVATAVLAAWALAGGWIVDMLGLRTEPLAVRLVIGAGLGIGGLSLVVLGLGSAGVLTQTTAIVVAAVGAVAALTRLALDLRRAVCGRTLGSQGACHDLAFSDPARTGAAGAPALARFHWLWLLVCPFLSVGLLAACLPPGVLWKEEGAGYDVLEYHLAAPKAFHDAGRIAFLPHNVYASFPLNSEMLYLLMMTLRGDAIAAAFMAQMVNVALAALFVAAAWLAGRLTSPLAGVVAGVLAGTLPWTTYLAGIAFVEIGLLAMGMCAFTAAVRATDGHAAERRWYLVAGLLAGLACGFKYTALPCIALPVMILPMFRRGPSAERLLGVGRVAVGTALAFSPWMIRNLVNTGNPVFPLAYSVFGAREGAWDETLEQRWRPAHGPEGGDAPWKPADRLLLYRTLGDFRMGPVVFVLALIGAVAGGNRLSLALILILVLQFGIWAGATHRYARFAVVMLPPMLVLAGQAAGRGRPAALARVVCVILIAGAAWHLYQVGRLFYDHTRLAGQPIRAYGRTDWFVTGQWPGTEHFGAINALDESARVMLVGEARTYYLRRPVEYAVVFSHHPLAQAAERLTDGRAVLDWLRQRGTTHLLAHWREIRRLRSSYGYEPVIDEVLFEELTNAGLTEVRSFGDEPEWLPYATLYHVGPNGPAGTKEDPHE